MVDTETDDQFGYAALKSHSINLQITLAWKKKKEKYYILIELT